MHIISGFIDVRKSILYLLNNLQLKLMIRLSYFRYHNRIIIYNPRTREIGIICNRIFNTILLVVTKAPRRGKRAIAHCSPWEFFETICNCMSSLLIIIRFY